ncbi:YjjG family noncanonical pyrimidine nucleotidase [Weissella tructae]|nr:MULTISPECIES: YjjG family noncanonical pyrimidine nucleotidase [Weissella]QVV91789.1 YjjG family noncanonical pyrimidine nucleotidase [Weissella tructae]
MMYKYLIFDLDDTLLDFKAGEHEGLLRVLTNAGITDVAHALERYAVINRALWQRYEQGEITKADIQQTRFPDLLKQLEMTGDGIAMERAYRNELNHNNHLIPGAETLLKQLSAMNYVLIAGTNGETQTQKMRLTNTGFGEFFDQVYISDELGSAKPDPMFYEPIFTANADMTTDNTVMIGDGIPSDMRGGIAVGLDTIWVNLKDQVLPDDISVTHEVNTLNQLGRVLGAN